MIKAKQIIAIEEARHVGDYKLALLFNDHTEQVVDFYPFLSSSLNPLITEYLDMGKFLNFEVDEGDLEWNDYDLFSSRRSVSKQDRLVVILAVIIHPSVECKKA